MSKVTGQLDPHVLKLVHAMNQLPGIETSESCEGHGADPFRIWFIVTDFEARGLLTLSRLLSPNYYSFWGQFRIIVDHRDVKPQVCFLLESRGHSCRETYSFADGMAQEIHALVEGTTPHYNILYDRVGQGGEEK